MKKIFIASFCFCMISLFNSCKKESSTCPEHYTGSDCSEQITPSQITLTKIEVTGFPATESAGGGWDNNDGPDIFPVLLQGANDLVNAESSYIEDANFNTDYIWTLGTPLSLNASSQYVLGLYDYDDFDPNDTMGEVSFKPYSSTGGFPATKEISGNGISFRLYLTYSF